MKNSESQQGFGSGLGNLFLDARRWRQERGRVAHLDIFTISRGTTAKVARFLTSNPQRFLVWSDQFTRPETVLEEQGCYAAEIRFPKLFRPTGERVGILGENDRALLDIRLGEDFEVVADDMSIRRIGSGDAFDHFVIVRRTNRVTEIEGDDVEMLQRKIACWLSHLELGYDQGGEAKKMPIRHAVPEVIHSS